MTWHPGRFYFFHLSILALICLGLATQRRADTLSGTVKDPSGGVVIGARIEITGGNLAQPLVLSSDESGKEVDENFAMFVPIFADFGDGMVRLTQVGIAGNSTKTYNFVLDRKPKKVALNAYKEILER